MNRFRSVAIRVWKGEGFNKNATLTQYRYYDGDEYTDNHWLFRDRQGRPYNPEDQAEVDKIVKEWRLKDITEEI